VSAARACRTARGAAGNFGEQIGLSDAWAANVIRSVGNCGEAFERNLGSNTLLAILFVEPAERADLEGTCERRSQPRMRRSDLSTSAKRKSDQCFMLVTARRGRLEAEPKLSQISAKRDGARGSV